DDVVVLALEHVTGPQLDNLDRVGQPAEHPPQGREEVLQAGRPVDGQRNVPAAERERLQHARQAEVVVGVEMRDEYLAQLDKPDRRAQELPLGALAAVEQQPLAPAPDEQRRRRPLGGRNRAGGAEEDEVEFHAESLVSPDSSNSRPQPIVARGSCDCGRHTGWLYERRPSARSRSCASSCSRARSSSRSAPSSCALSSPARSTARPPPTT